MPMSLPLAKAILQNPENFAPYGVPYQFLFNNSVSTNHHDTYMTLSVAFDPLGDEAVGGLDVLWHSFVFLYHLIGGDEGDMYFPL